MEWRQAAEWGSREKLVFGSWGLRPGDGGLRHPRPATSGLVVLFRASRRHTGKLGVCHLSVLFTLESRAESSGGRKNWNKEQGDEY